jgi:hypothetical protein
MDPEPEYLSKKHAAIVYDTSVGKLEGEIRAGRLRAFNIGRKILIGKKSLDAWISSCEVTHQEQSAKKSDLRLLVDRAVERARKGATA